MDAGGEVVVVAGAVCRCSLGFLAAAAAVPEGVGVGCWRKWE
jgi:hypothetical protein